MIVETSNLQYGPRMAKVQEHTSNKHYSALTTVCSHFPRVTCIQLHIERPIFLWITYSAWQISHLPLPRQIQACVPIHHAHHVNLFILIVLIHCMNMPGQVHKCTNSSGWATTILAKRKNFQSIISQCYSHCLSLTASYIRALSGFNMRQKLCGGSSAFLYCNKNPKPRWQLNKCCFIFL